MELAEELGLGQRLVAAVAALAEAGLPVVELVQVEGPVAGLEQVVPQACQV